MTRKKTKYPGVYYREAKRIGGKGQEKVYYVIYKQDGKTVEEKVGRQYADDMTPSRAASFRADLIEGRRLTRKEAKEQEEGRWTISRLWELFKEQKQSNKSFRDDRIRYDKELRDLFGNKTPEEIVTLDIDRMKNNLKKQGLAPATIRQYVVLLQRIINHGIRKGVIPALDPSRLHFERPKVNNETTEDLTADQLTKLLEVLDKEANPQLANLMKLALYTGMRRGELFRLQWKHIDFDRGFILLVDPKGGVDQKIPLNEPARQLLLGHERSDSPYVFPGRGGRQRTTIKHSLLERIRQKAGLPEGFRPLHGLRHVYASMLASSGKVDMYTLQKLLTHKSPAMTQRYAHLRDDALKRAAGVAGEVFGAFGSKGAESADEKAEKQSS